jgi:CRISPR-associated endonuclease Cas2
MKLHRDSRTYKILKHLLIAGGFLIISGAAPLAGAQIAKGLIKAYFRNRKFKKELFLRDLKRLQTRKLIDYRVLPDGRISLVLSKRGKQYKLIYDFDNMQLNKEKWDGQWRLVMFDIPDYKKRARDVLRGKLASLGLYSVQESVFLTPYECEKEIDFICSVFDIDRNNVLIFYVDSFEGEEKFRHHFKI